MYGSCCGKRRVIVFKHDLLLAKSYVTTSYIAIPYTVPVMCVVHERMHDVCLICVFACTYSYVCMCVCVCPVPLADIMPFVSANELCEHKFEPDACAHADADAELVPAPVALSAPLALGEGTRAPTPSSSLLVAPLLLSSVHLSFLVSTLHALRFVAFVCCEATRHDTTRPPTWSLARTRQFADEFRVSLASLHSSRIFRFPSSRRVASRRARCLLLCRSASSCALATHSLHSTPLVYRAIFEQYCAPHCPEL